MSPKEEREWLNWKLDHNIITQKELLLYFNPDMSDEELEAKMNMIMEENRQVANSKQPQSTFQRILDGAGAASG